MTYLKMDYFNGPKLLTSVGTIITEVKDDIKISWDSYPAVVKIFADSVTLNNAVVIDLKLNTFSTYTNNACNIKLQRMLGEKYIVCHQTSCKRKIKTSPLNVKWNSMIYAKGKCKSF